jgi:hypothetical protein
LCEEHNPAGAYYQPSVRRKIESSLSVYTGLFALDESGRVRVSEPHSDGIVIKQFHRYVVFLTVFFRRSVKGPDLTS